MASVHETSFYTHLYSPLPTYTHLYSPVLTCTHLHSPLPPTLTCTTYTHLYPPILTIHIHILVSLLAVLIVTKG